MNKILELREKRAKAWEAAKAFLDSKRGADGLLSAEDVATYDKMEADVVNLGKEIDRLERQQALDAELSKPVNTPITGKPAVASGEEKTGRASAEYRKSFWNAMRSKMPGHEILNALQVGTDSEGGYLVPDEFEHTLVEALEEQNIFRTLAHVIQTSSGDRKIPVVASKGTASWVDEEGAIPESDDAFSQVSIGAYKLGTMIKVSEELINDSVFDLEAYIAREFARRIGNKEEEAFFTGDGKGKPLGVLAATGGAEIGVTAASATAFTADEIFDLFYSLKAPYRKNAIFLMNDASVKALRKLKDMTGLDKDSHYTLPPDLLKKAQAKFFAGCCDDAATIKTIAQVWRQHHYLMDTHTAVAWNVAQQYKAACPEHAPVVVLSTASPYKFPGAVMEALKLDPAGDEFSGMEAIERATGVPMPANLRSLRERPRLHSDCVAKTAMTEYVIEKAEDKLWKK